MSLELNSGYSQKYLKYKSKYLELKHKYMLTGGAAAAAPVAFPRDSHGIYNLSGYKYKRNNYTEDRSSVLHSVDRTIHILSVFDGHGGDQTVCFIIDRLPVELLRRVELSDKKPVTIEKILHDCFLDVNRQYFDATGGDPSGCTGSVCVVTPDFIITANVGDSPIILFNMNGRVLETSVDHDCKNKLEKERVGRPLKQSFSDKVNPNFWDGRETIDVGVPNPCGFNDPRVERLDTGLMISRSFGDNVHPRVIAEPQTYIWERIEGSILCVCSDSFVENWSRCPGNGIVTNHNSVNKPEEPCQSAAHLVFNTNTLERDDVVRELLTSIRGSPDLQSAATNAVRRRVTLATSGKDKRNGDDTTLILLAN